MVLGIQYSKLEEHCISLPNNTYMEKHENETNKAENSNNSCQKNEQIKNKLEAL